MIHVRKSALLAALQAALLANAATTAAQQPRQVSPSARVLTIPTAGFEGNKPVGLFYRLKVNFSGGDRLDVMTLAFLPDNRVTRTYPFGGADSFDEQRRCNPDMCGTFQHSANAISIRWDNGQTSQWTYRRTEQGFELDGDTYKPARTFSQATLVGRWAGAITTGNSEQNTWQFLANGTFTFGAAAVRASAGRYSLTGTTLTLTWTDGSIDRRTVFGASSSDPISLASIEGDVYRRR